jgi:hypothetical protein
MALDGITGDSCAVSSPSYGHVVPLIAAQNLRLMYFPPGGGNGHCKEGGDYMVFLI